MEPNAWPLSAPRQSYVLVNAHRLVRKQFKGVPLWSFIREMTAHGSVISGAICVANGWDPDQDASLPIAVNPENPVHPV